MTRRLLFLVALSLAPSTLFAQSVRVDVRFTAAANLAYQLDCLGDVVQACAKNDYQALWQKEFLQNRSDSTRLNDWRALRQRYQSQWQPGTESTPGARSIDMSDRIRIATLQSTTTADLLTRLEVFFSPADWLLAREVLLHFDGRYMRWWEREAVPTGQPFVDRLKALLARDDVSLLLGRMARLYDTRFPLDAGVPMQLFYRPNLAPSGTSGQQIDRYAMLEFLPNESVRSRIDVAVHELCHFFWGGRADAQRDLLNERFRRSSSPAAIAARNLLNEALATALGNGILARMVSDSARWQRLNTTPLALYNNPYIDRAARVLIPIADSLLTRGETIDAPGVVEQYVAAIESAFGESATSPSLLLNELYLFVDGSLGETVRSDVRRTIRPASMYADQDAPAHATFSDFKTLIDLNALFVVTPSAIPVLVRRGIIPASVSTRLAKRARSSFPQVHVARRPSGAWWFFVIANDAASATKGLSDLSAMSRAVLSQ